MYLFINKAILTLGFILLCVVSIDLQAKSVEQHQFTHTNVLGTSFDMSIEASLEQAKKAEKRVLAEIERLEKIFSTYDNNSEISLLNQHGHSINKNLSNDLLAVIDLCSSWQQALPQSFSCRLGRVIEKWQSLEEQQERPERVKIREIARKGQQSQFSREDLIAGKKNTDFTWNFDGIAKGYILDKAMKAARNTAKNAMSIKLDIGGDGLYWKLSKEDSNWVIGLAQPNNIDDSQENKLGTLKIKDGALAYSGHNSRSRKIGRRAYSHILAPRDGWPTHNPLTAIVKAPDAASADALATALAASEISIAIDWLKEHPQYAALLIDSDGRQYASNNWYQHFQQTEKPVTPLNKGYLAKINFTLPKINSAEYRKPYVALWVADNKGKVVKNLLILGQSERWMKENRTWWRLQGRKAPQLLDGFARPTRRPGKYSISWNGRDDFGQQLPKGKYRLYSEAAREHGGHEKISIEIDLGNNKQSLLKKGKQEISELAFTSTSHDIQ